MNDKYARFRKQIDATMDRNKRLFGDTVMMTTPAPPDAPPAPTDAPPANDPGGVWGQGVQPPAVPTTVPAPTVTPAPGIPQGGMSPEMQAAVEQARREERDKLHNRLESLDAEVRSLREKREAEEKAAQEAEAARLAAEEAARLQEMSAAERIEAVNQQWEQRFQQIQEQQAAQNALFQKEREFQALNEFRTRRLAEESDLIHPTLVDYVVGNTPEEIEASITAAKAKTDAIVADLGAQQQMQRQAARGVAPTGAPPVGPMDTTSQQQSYSAADIASMDPATYAKHRAALLQAASSQAAEGRLYG